MTGSNSKTILIRQVGAALGVYLLVAMVCIWPALVVPGPSVPGSEQTDLFNGLWGSWFVRESILSGHIPWEVSSLNFPHGGRILILDPMGSIFVSLGSVFVGMTGAYTSLVVFRIVASGLMAHFFVRFWLMEECRVGSQEAVRASWLAGLLYSTAPVLLIGVHNGNAESLNGAWLVAAVWGSWMAAREGGTKWVLAAGVGLLGASLANWYSGVCGFLFAGAFLLLGAGEEPWKTHLRTRALVLVLGLVLVLPVAGLVRKSHSHPEELSRIQSEESIQQTRRGEGAASVQGWVVQDSNSKITGQPGRSVYRSAHGLGVVALLTAVWSLVRRRRVTRVWLLGGMAGGVLAMGPVLEFGGRSVPLPYALIEGIAGFDGLSLLWRLGQAPALSVAVLVALAFTGLGRLGSRLLVAGLVIELVWLSPVMGRLGGVSIEVPEAFLGLAGAPPGAVLTYPVGARERELLHQLTHAHPLTRSLDTLQNDTEYAFWEAMAAESNQQERLQEVGVRYLVVHDHVSARGDPHRGIVQELESRVSPGFGAGTSSRVYAFW